MNLDPQAQALLDAGARARMLPLAALTPRAARERLRAGFLSHGPGPELYEVSDYVVPGPGRGCPIRFYRAKAPGEPLIMFMHGGGGVVNSVETHDRLCRILAESAGVTVVSVDYRLAPEDPYPAGLQDCIGVWYYLHARADELKLDARASCVMGDSSGGSLALAVSATTVDLGTHAPSLQCLLYPVADHYSAGFGSYISRGEGYSLDAASMQWFVDHYLPDNWNPVDGFLFPLRRKDFAGFPATILSVCEFDPLRDEGNELGRRLEEDGVRVERIPAAAQMHGYAMQTKNIDEAKRLVEEIALKVGEHLRGCLSPERRA